MTNWLPDISRRPGPKYRAIAETLAQDITGGALSAGDRMPTHRDLAWRLGVTVGTVSRAYALAQSWGLLAGTVGRGTIVLPAAAPLPARGDSISSFSVLLNPGGGPQTIEMSRNFPNDERTGAVLANGLKRIADPASLGRMATYGPPNGAETHRRAGAGWLAEMGLEADPESILIVNGCQHGLWVAFSALARPGDVVLTESLTWPGSKRLAAMLGLRIHGVAMDDQGLRPDSLEEACRAGNARLLYTVPTFQNPTVSIMPEERRRAIASIARKYEVTIVEDDVFGFLATDAPPPVAAIAPDITVYVTSLSKSVTPALRAGFLAAPTSLVPQLSSVIQSSTIMPPMLGAQLAAELIRSGAAAETAARHRQTAADRRRLAANILGRRLATEHPYASQLWLSLPDQWTTREFVAEALARGVAVTPGDAFAVSENEADPHAIRVGLCAEADRARIEEGLRVLAALLASHPGATTPII